MFRLAGAQSKSKKKKNLKLRLTEITLKPLIRTNHYGNSMLSFCYMIPTVGTQRSAAETKSA